MDFYDCWFSLCRQIEGIMSTCENPLDEYRLNGIATVKPFDSLLNAHIFHLMNYKSSTFQLNEILSVGG